MATLVSATGFLGLLQEGPELRVYALENLDKLVDEFWAELASSVGKIEVLAEDDTFPARELASLVASKVYYHLEQFNLSMRYALGAGSRFDIFGKKSEYIETLVAKFVDDYIKQRVQQAEAKDEKEKPKVDERLERIVGNMFDRCFKETDFKPALGIAIESRRLDKVRESIKLSADRAAMLAYAYRVCMNQVTSREFRQEVLRNLVDLHQEQPEVDYLSVVNCLVFLDDANRVAAIVSNLLKGQEAQTLIAFQIGFDLVENSTQEFRNTVRESLAGAGTATGATSMEVDSGADAPYLQRVKQFKNILSGEVPIGLALEFLSRNNHADQMILKNIKTTVEARSSVTHQATIFANALMHAGTTRDAFLRENIEWLAKATNWAKFSATAGLGVIHKGHLKEGLTLLGPYLPQGGASSSPYSEGGALYALGIIHANHGGDIVKYLLNALRTASETNINEVVQHGACLGLGLAAMATRSSEIYEALKTVMYTDNAVAGEAAGIAMGLVMLGSASQEALSDMLAYAHETQHEKIIRGLAIGIALIMYSREEQADTLIEQLCMDKDPILRYGGMYTVGLAYAGTANSRALKRLLHVAVSDVSDDVRRAATINLGFLLFRQPRECPRLVSLLAASYNPHVRYGAALAVGIACAGSSLKDALDLLEPLTSDATDFVRQGALISVAMVLMQTNKVQEPRSETFRNSFAERVGDKHEELMAKFGAILAAGVIDAGGRNVTISLASRSGHSNMVGIVGVALFTQLWYWYPLIHMITLAFAPTAVIGLNKDLKMPKMSFKCNARPSLFAYPPDVKPPEKKEITKVATAVLSTAAKTKARKEADKMDVSAPPSPNPAPANPTNTTPGGATAAAPAAGSAPAALSEKKEEEKKEEPTFEILQNPARVTPTQARLVTFDVDERYSPVRKDAHGFVMLKDNKPGTPEELVGNTPPPAPAPAPVPPASPAPAPAAGGQGEPAPPEAFEFTE